MSAKTPVTILQEFMIKRKDTPNYDLICNETGTHDPLFKYLVTGLGLSAIGSGKSKKEAKHEAARLLLIMLKEKGPDNEVKKNPILKEVNSCYSPYDDTIKDNAVGSLQTFCCDYSLPNPEYHLLLDVGPPHFKSFTIRCCVSSFYCEATAHTKKQAKHRSSAALMEKLKQSLVKFIDIADYPRGSTEKVACELAQRTAYFGCTLTQLCNIFKTLVYPESPTLKDLCTKTVKDSPQKPLETLQVLADELNFTVDIKELASKRNDLVLVNIFLVSKPGWSFIGHGVNYDEAVRSASIEAINFLKTMSN